ncbi:hypothetical protein FOL47_008054 [Perkinsus chesapeaki]|uniref:Uncharacterized protein n=1 Tax=Perkinsus chesapeaki TaxID=330153 RepID=A0A7J6N3B4_PERCH|nr:hypothetical protein FOL47_008054 [Perkinsus chesapeaki]
MAGVGATCLPLTVPIILEENRLGGGAGSKYSVFDKIKGAATGLVKGRLDYCDIGPSEGNIIDIKVIQIPGIGYRSTFKAQCIDEEKEWSSTGSAHSTKGYHGGVRTTKLTGDDRCDDARWRQHLNDPENNIKLHRQACNEDTGRSSKETEYTTTARKEERPVVEGCAIEGSNKGTSLHIDMVTQGYYFISSKCGGSRTKETYIADVLKEKDQIALLKEPTTEGRCMTLLKHLRLAAEADGGIDMLDAIACKKVTTCRIIEYEEYTGADEGCIARIAETGSNGIYIGQGGVDDHVYGGPMRKAIGPVMKLRVNGGGSSKVHEVCDKLSKQDRLKLAQSVACFGATKRKSKVEAKSILRRGWRKLSQSSDGGSSPTRKEMESHRLTCDILFSNNNTELIFERKGIEDSSYYYKSDACRSATSSSSPHTYLKLSMGKSEIGELLKESNREQCRHLRLHFHLGGFEGAAMADAKACHKATGCLLKTTKPTANKNVSCIAYYTEYQGVPIGYAEKMILGDNVDDMETIRTSTFPRELDEVYRLLYKPQDCESLKEVTTLLCQELGVEAAYETKIYNRSRKEDKKVQYLIEIHFIIMIPINLAQIDDELACIKSIYDRQEYLRNIAHAKPRAEVDKLDDVLIDEGVKDISKANWAHSIALFITSILEDKERIYKIVNVTPSTKVRIKAATTLIKMLKEGDDSSSRLMTNTKDLILNKGAPPHLRRAIIKTIVDDNMQSLADSIIDELYASYGPSVALQLLPAYYMEEVEYFIIHRSNTDPNALSLVFTYLNAVIDDADTEESSCKEIDPRILRVLTSLMRHGHSKEAIDWIYSMKERGLSFKDVHWPIEALVRDLGEDKAFGILYDNIPLQSIPFLTRGLPNDVTTHTISKASLQLEHLSRFAWLINDMWFQGAIYLIIISTYYSDKDKFPYEDQQLEFVEYMPLSNADPILADRLKSSNTDKRTWAYIARLRQALHYDKKEHMLPDVLATTVNSIANERIPVRENVMRVISSLPIPPLCEPKCTEPSKVIEAVDNLETTLNRSKEQVKGSFVVRQVQNMISRIIQCAPLESMLYKKWELRVMEAYDRLINNDNFNKSLIDDGFLLNISALRRATVENILSHLNAFLNTVLNTKDRLSKDIIQDLRVIFRLVGGQYRGLPGDGLKLDGIRGIVEDIIDNSEKYTFRPRHPAGTIDMLIEIQSTLAEALKRRPWNKEKGNYLERIIKAHPQLLTDNNELYTLARKKMPYLFAKYMKSGSSDDNKPAPPRCCRRFSGGIYDEHDIDMDWWTDSEVEVINNMVDTEYSGDSDDIKQQQRIIEQAAANSSEGGDGGGVDGDALALMEVDMKALSCMDTIDVESSKVFLTSDILSSDVARTAPFCISRVSSNVLTDEDLFGSLIKNAAKSNIKLTAHKELCRLVAHYGSIHRRQYWLKYRLFNADGSRKKNVHKDIVESIGSAFIHNMSWSSDWEVLDVCMDMSKTTIDALAKYIIPSPATLNGQFSDTTQARCRYITKVLLPIFQYASGDQVVMDSCIAALRCWSLGTPALLECAGGAIVEALKPVLTKKGAFLSMVTQVVELFDAFVARGSKAALSAEMAAFDYLLENSYKPLVQIDSPVPTQDEVNCPVLKPITNHLLKAGTNTKICIPKHDCHDLLYHIADALTDVLGLEELWNKATIASILYDKSPADFTTIWPTIQDHLNIIEGDNELLRDCISSIGDWLQPSSIGQIDDELTSNHDYRMRLIAVEMYSRKAKVDNNNDETAMKQVKSAAALWRTLCRDPNMLVRRAAFNYIMST